MSLAASVQFFDQTPLVDDPYSRAQRVHFGQDVARHEDRHALPARKRRKQVANLDHARRVEPIGRLASEKDMFSMSSFRPCPTMARS